jgi:flagellar biosynthesis/type III secretory pathway M-ring protein FliF/YscJ
VAALVLLALLALVLRRVVGHRAEPAMEYPGSQRLSGTAAGGGALPPTPNSSAGALPAAPFDPAGAVRERARALAEHDPSRAAHILKGWMQNDAPAGSPHV